MECRNTFGPVSSRSHPSLTGDTQPQPQRHRYRCRPRRLFECENDDEDDNNNNNRNVSAATNIVSPTTTTLMDELEQLRTDNFQLRLRVYNAERRVDLLSATTAAERFKRGRETENSPEDDSDSDSDASSSDCSTNENVDTDDVAAARATAEAAVRTVHDLLTVNRRLLALLAATVSAKAIAVTAADKKRWRRLQNHIHDFGGELDEEEEIKMEGKQLNYVDDDESDMSVTDSETYTTKVKRVSAERKSTGQRVATLLPPSPPSSTTHEPDKRATATGDDDDSAGSELSRLRARCRRLERSLQQLVNTELWARNRQIGKLEQQRYMSQLHADTTEQKDRPSVVQRSRGPDAPPAATKGILVIRSPTPVAETPLEISPVAITTPPSVLPDYSEVNFFFSCDEEDDGDENCTDSNVTTSSAEEQTDSGDVEHGQEPVRILQPTNTTKTAVTQRPVVRRPQKRRRTRPQQLQPSGRQGDVIETATTWSSSSSSSSTESLAVVASDDLSDGDGVATTRVLPTPKRSRRRRRTASGRGLHKRRPRWKPAHQCSTCGRSSGGGSDSAESRLPPTSRVVTAVADAQVQCGNDSENDVKVDNNNCNNNDGADEDQLLLLRRELDARRRENCRLYDMLLKLQRSRGTRKNINAEDGSGVPDVLSLDDLRNTIENSSDRCGSPEPYRRAACAVRGRIAELLPPLLSTQSSTSVGSPSAAANAETEDDQLIQNNVLEQQQQQQLLLLTRLRERIVAYERRELQLGSTGNDSGSVSSTTADPDTAVHHMDRADLVNVALPRTVDRLRRVLMPLIQQQQQRPEPSDKQTDVQQMDPQPQPYQQQK